MPSARVVRTRLAPPPTDAVHEELTQAAAKPAKKAVSRSKALSGDTLEGLGTRRLAELLIDAA